MTVIPLNGRRPDDPDPTDAASATGISEGAADSASTRGRARARVEAPNATPDTDPDATPDTAADGAVTTARSSDDTTAHTVAEGRDRLAAFSGLMRPPDVWHQPRPSLRQVWCYAAYGPWTDQTTTTPARYAGVAYGALVLAVTCLAYLALWALERPGRAAVTATVLTVADLVGIPGVPGPTWLIP